MAVILPPVPSVIKAKFTFNIGSDANANSHLFFHYTGSPPSAADLTTYAGAIMASWVADLQQLQSTYGGIESVECIDLSTTATQPGLVAVGHEGTRTGTPLPAEVATLISLKIGRRYRGGHPRVYMPFGAAGDMQDPQHWNSAFLNQAQNQWNSFVSSLLGVGPPGPTCDHLANVSYYTAHALRPTPIVDTVLSSVVSGIPASQRRRMNR